MKFVERMLDHLLLDTRERHLSRSPESYAQLAPLGFAPMWRQIAEPRRFGRARS
jgi:hypothetical protein